MKQKEREERKNNFLETNKEAIEIMNKMKEWAEKDEERRCVHVIVSSCEKNADDECCSVVGAGNPELIYNALFHQVLSLSPLGLMLIDIVRKALTEHTKEISKTEITIPISEQMKGKA